jgi:hypothetical protein
MMKIPLPPPNLDYIGCRCWDLYLGYFRGSWIEVWRCFCCLC